MDRSSIGMWRFCVMENVKCKAITNIRSEIPDLTQMWVNQANQQFLFYDQYQLPRLKTQVFHWKEIWQTGLRFHGAGVQYQHFTRQKYE